MRRREAFLPTAKESRIDGIDETELLDRAGLVRDFGSGLWAYTPAGLRVRRKIELRVRAGMETIGGQELSLPSLQYDDHWRESGRWGNFENEMITLENRDGMAMCLAPSHEEAVVHLLDGVVRSYDDLPLLVYQTGSKFRDDHARNGLVRTKEFTMKDAYSVHTDAASLDNTYEAVRDAYRRIVADLGLDVAIVEVEDDVMGGSTSEEFVAPVQTGSDRLVSCSEADCTFGVTDGLDRFEAYEDGADCPDCDGTLVETDGIEIGHVFKLGTRYPEAMEFRIDDGAGGDQAVLMGSYGIGIDRLLQTIVHQHGTDDSCGWPVTDWGSVAPWRAGILPVTDEDEVHETATEIYESLGCEDVLLFDDREQSAGECFAEAELLGLPVLVIVGNGFQETGMVDVERSDGTTTQVAPEDVSEAVAEFVGEGRIQ